MAGRRQLRPAFFLPVLCCLCGKSLVGQAAQLATNEPSAKDQLEAHSATLPSVLRWMATGTKGAHFYETD